LVNLDNCSKQTWDAKVRCKDTDLPFSWKRNLQHTVIGEVRVGNWTINLV